MLDYMYTGDYKFVDEKNILSVISLVGPASHQPSSTCMHSLNLLLQANYYGVWSLKEACGTLLGYAKTNSMDSC